MNLPARNETPPPRVQSVASAPVLLPRVGAGTTTGAVFLAALSPMLTVSSLRHLVVDVHGGSASNLHLFVAIGMVGAAVFAPAIAAHADAKKDHLVVATILAAVDTVVTLASQGSIPTWTLFALRPIHGAASMGLVALLLGRLRDGERRLVSHGGAAMIAALAIGPALGGALSRATPSAPFLAAATCSAALAALLALQGVFTASAERIEPARRSFLALPLRALVREARRPLGAIFVQRLAIGGFVTSFALRGRAAFGLSDALVGVCFSVVLLTFAIATRSIGGRVQRSPEVARPFVFAGASVFALAFFALAFGSKVVLAPALLAAGAAAAFVYAPSLAAAASIAPSRSRASMMALVHAAGALGMIAGPLLAALLELALPETSIQVRASLYLAGAGMLQLFAAPFVSVLPRVRSLAFPLDLSQPEPPADLVRSLHPSELPTLPRKASPPGR